MRSPDHGIDRLLDRSVVLGYSRLGLAWRRRGWSTGDPRPRALAGRTVLVTGAGSGLGEASALGLGRLGARVHLVVRSAERARPAVERIATALDADGIRPDLHIDECDVSDLGAVREFSERFVTDHGTTAVDGLVHNAGVMPPQRTESVDGHELTVATHVLGPVLMTELLRPVLRRSATGARVVFVASGGMYTQSLPVEDPQFERGEYGGAVAYARSKRMQVELTPVLARRWNADTVTVHTMHPGWADTPGVTTSMPLFTKLTRPLLRSPAAGADTVVWLTATEPAPPSGRFWHDRQQRPTSYRRSTHPTGAEVDEMWRWVRDATGLDVTS